MKFCKMPVATVKYFTGDISLLGGYTIWYFRSRGRNPWIYKTSNITSKS
jgi:hypothetical protein